MSRQEIKSEYPKSNTQSQVREISTVVTGPKKVQSAETKNKSKIQLLINSEEIQRGDSSGFRKRMVHRGSSKIQITESTVQNPMSLN